MVKTIHVEDATWDMLTMLKHTLKERSMDTLLQTLLARKGAAVKPLKTLAPSKSRTIVINKGEPITEVMQVGEGEQVKLPDKETSTWSDTPSPDAVLKQLKETH